MATENRPFYDAVACVLSCALQADSEIQRLAEERIKALEMVDGEIFVYISIIDEFNFFNAQIYFFYFKIPVIKPEFCNRII